MDRSDEIVGAWRAPDWVHRIPPLAWLFFSLAALDVAIRLALPGGQPWAGAPPIVAVSFLVQLVGAAVILALPAAVLSGPARGQTRRALLVGAVALALAEVVAVGRAAWASLIVVDDVGRFGLGAAAAVLAATLAVVGSGALLVAARRAAPRTVRPSAAGIAVVALAAVLSALPTILLIARLVPVVGAGVTIEPVTLLSLPLALAALVAWGFLAVVALAARSLAEPSNGWWTAIATSAWLVFLGGTATNAAQLFALVLPTRPAPAATDTYLVAVQAAVATGVIGFVVLFGALLAGPPAPAANRPTLAPVAGQRTPIDD